MNEDDIALGWLLAFDCSATPIATADSASLWRCLWRCFKSKVRYRYLVVAILRRRRANRGTYVSTTVRLRSNGLRLGDAV